jgi:hypothetical protein
MLRRDSILFAMASLYGSIMQPYVLWNQMANYQHLMGTYCIQIQFTFKIQVEYYFEVLIRDYPIVKGLNVILAITVGSYRSSAIRTKHEHVIKHSCGT